MASLLAFLFSLMTTPLAVQLQRLPQYAQTAHRTNDQFFAIVELWRLDAMRKATVESFRKADAVNAEYKRRFDALDLRQEHLRRKLEAEEKAKEKPGG